MFEWSWPGRADQRASRIGFEFGPVGQCEIRQVTFKFMLGLQALGFVEQCSGFRKMSQRAAGIGVIRQRPRDRGGNGAFPSGRLTRVLQLAQRLEGLSVAQQVVAPMSKKGQRGPVRRIGSRRQELATASDPRGNRAGRRQSLIAVGAYVRIDEGRGSSPPFAPIHPARRCRRESLFGSGPRLAVLQILRDHTPVEERTGWRPSIWPRISAADSWSPRSWRVRASLSMRCR